MPPRKKARTSPAHSHPPPTISPTPTSQAKTPSPASPKPALLDPWTDEEESALYKGLIKYKPTGIHKHFRLLQLRAYLLQHGYIHPLAAHTSLPGLWHKLAELYDLEALDQREDARQLSDFSEEVGGDEDEGEDEEEDDVYSVALNKIHKEPFALPEGEFGQAMWERRLAGRAGKEESPPELREVNLMEEAPVRFTPSFSVEPSEIAGTPVEVGKRGRGRPRGSGRGGAVAAAQAAGTRRSRRQVEESAGDEEEVEGSSGEDSGEESSEEEESEESTPAPRAGRSGKGRGRGGRGGSGRGRGRKRG